MAEESSTNRLKRWVTNKNMRSVI